MQRNTNMMLETSHAAWILLQLEGIWNARVIDCDLSAENYWEKEKEM